MDNRIIGCDGQRMKTFSESCYEILQSELMKRTTKELMQPVVGLIYNSIYPYIWAICILNVFLFVLILGNFLLLLKLSWVNDKNLAL